MQTSAAMADRHDLLALLGAETLAGLTADLTPAQQHLVDEFLEQHPADLPLHALTLRAPNDDGSVADQAALDELLAAAEVTR